MPESLALVDRLRAEGHAAVVSGAGPSVLVLTRRTDADTADPAAGARVRELAALVPAGWQIIPSGVDVRGARVEPLAQQVSSS
jgi:homoserine kinase